MLLSVSLLKVVDKKDQVLKKKTQKQAQDLCFNLILSL